MKLVKLKKDRERHYVAIIEINGVVFESVYVKTLTEWAVFFNISIDDIKNYLKNITDI